MGSFWPWFLASLSCTPNYLLSDYTDYIFHDMWEPTTLLPLLEVTRKVHKILETTIFIALSVLVFLPTSHKRILPRLSSPCCFTLMWHLHLVCVLWVFHGILRVRINHYHVPVIITERPCVYNLFSFSFHLKYLVTFMITFMIGRRDFQNLWLPNSLQNQIFPKP